MKRGREEDDVGNEEEEDDFGDEKIRQKSGRIVYGQRKMNFARESKILHYLWREREKEKMILPLFMVKHDEDDDEKDEKEEIIEWQTFKEKA